uniref:MIP20456p n=1 Tax=Drosophila melanogaster TaxID=7227 RepID=D5A7P4_DROME|nr:MIP20456p [Drosophila melanogaster]
MEGYSWPRLVISLPASHFSFFSALSAIWQTAKLETAKGQKATGQQGRRTGMGECGTCSCANRQTSKWNLEGRCHPKISTTITRVTSL